MAYGRSEPAKRGSRTANETSGCSVEDFRRGMSAVLEGGKAGEVYNVGGPSEAKNIDVVNRIVEFEPGADGSLITFVEDRLTFSAATRSRRRR